MGLIWDRWFYNTKDTELNGYNKKLEIQADKEFKIFKKILYDEVGEVFTKGQGLVIRKIVKLILGKMINVLGRRRDK